MKPRSIPLFLILLFIFTGLSLFNSSVFASHIVGGEVTYRYLGTAVGGYKYQVSLTIYEDCLPADVKPGVIAEDNPAHLTLFDVASLRALRSDSIYYTLNDSVPSNFNNLCVKNPPVLCLLKKTFNIVYVLPANSSGYLVSYQRCCRNKSVMNIIDAANTGCTYYCVIPPAPVINTSAVFKNYPPQIICRNNPLNYDNSAYDADGDSLSYEFCNALVGGKDPQALVPDPPPYDSVVWTPGYFYTHPLPGSVPIAINPATGEITGTPSVIGRYLVTVCCHEWREGSIINTIKREFQFVVTDCSKAVVACMPQYSTDYNTYVVNCEDYNVHFDNCSSGGTNWLWDFGLPVPGKRTSGDFQPTFTYPDTGTFTVKLIANPGSTCEDSIERFVKIYPKFHTAFSDSGRYCTGFPISFTDLSSTSIKPVTYWKWDFGDGESSSEQNPHHNFAYGGTYDVLLISKNTKNCVDTSFHKLVIDNFRPSAGMDTTIVKGEKIHFNAFGGTEYVWTPSANLSDTIISNPVGYFPDTGRFTYVVHVNNLFGCSGFDTIHVSVINQAEFFMPNAFTPNGDGRNDIFRPVAIGYKSIRYFKIFNRWGELVYNDNSFEAGWDGSYKSQLAEMGTYFWEIGFTDILGKESALKGDVVLIR